jgi:CcmD family protein
MKQFIITLFVLFAGLLANAQEHPVPQPTGLAADNKIYVVLVVALTILLGLFLYLIRLDRKITKLEKEL